MHRKISQNQEIEQMNKEQGISTECPRETPCLLREIPCSLSINHNFLQHFFLSKANSQKINSGRQR